MIIEYLQNFFQRNKGDLSGTIWATKNIDPHINPGKINISKVLGYRTNTDDKANLEAPAWGFAYGASIGTTDRYFAVADDRCWETSSTDPNSPWTEMSSTPTDIDKNSDIQAFNSKIYIATANNLKSFDGNFGGGTFADVDTLNASPHSITIYANRLYVTDLNERVYSMNTSEVLSKTGSNTLDLNTVTGKKQQITKIQSVSDGIWVATLFTEDSGGEMVKWDGETENITSARYQVPRGVLSMTIKDDRPYMIDSLGRLRVFDGTTFTEIARLPIKDEILDKFNDGDNDRFIHPNGMIVVNDEIYVLVNNTPQDNTQDPIENLPAGVWAWNQERGFYHKYSLADLDITSPTQTDYGVSEVAAVGALFQSDATGGSTVDREDESEIMAGIQYYSDATATKAAIGITNVQNTIQKGGYFVTAQLNAETFDEIWKEVVAVSDRLKNSTDRIVLKYRTYVSDPIYGTGTWAEDTRLTSTDDLSTLDEGDELEILRGNGAGACLTIDYISGTQVRFTENSLSGMTGTCRFRAQKWKEIGVQKETDEQFLRKTLNKKDAWVQFKVFMVGTGMSPQLTKLYSVSEPNSKFN